MRLARRIQSWFGRMQGTRNRSRRDHRVGFLPCFEAFGDSEGTAIARSSRVSLHLEALEARTTPALTPVASASYPFSAIVHINATFPNGKTAQGTGALIDGTHVLTAGHVIFDATKGGDGWADQVTVHAGQTSYGRFLGQSAGVRWRTFNSYIADSQDAAKRGDTTNSHPAADGDIGLITLGENLSGVAGSFYYGTLPSATFANTKLNTAGYPSSYSLGNNMFSQYGTIDGTINGSARDSSGAPLFQSFQFSQANMHFEKGQSGSPVWGYYTSGENKGKSIIYGVMDVFNNQSGYAERITTPVFKTIEAWIASDKANAPTNTDQYNFRGFQSNATSTSLSASTTTAASGQQITLTANVYGNGGASPSGNVRFFDNDVFLGQGPLNGGQATFTTSGLEVGPHSISAIFDPFGDFLNSASPPSPLTIVTSPSDVPPPIVPPDTPPDIFFFDFPFFPDDPFDTSPPQGNSTAGAVRFEGGSHLAREADGSARLTLTRTGGSAGVLTVPYVIRDGTARSGSGSGTITFAAGETTKTLTIPLIDDRLVQGSQEFEIEIKGAADGLQSIATVDIVDDDLPQVPKENPDLGVLQRAGLGFGTSEEHYRDFVRRAYDRFLGRQPDEGGFRYWVQLMQLYQTSNHTQGLRQEDIEAGFLDSAEYKGRYGGVGEAWIAGIYRDLLGRSADAAGAQFWLNQLQQGVPPEAVAEGFTASDERLRNRVQETYRTLLGREAEPSGLAYWMGVFKAGGTTEDINSGFVGSVEYYYNPDKGNGNPAEWISKAYADVLFRYAAPEEMGYWLTFLKQGRPDDPLPDDPSDPLPDDEFDFEDF